MKIACILLLLLVAFKTVSSFEYQFSKVENCSTLDKNVISVENCRIGATGTTLEVVLDFKRPVNRLFVR